MFSLAAIKALQIYGISIAISMVVAVLIKLLVVVTSRVNSASKVAKAPIKTEAPPITPITDVTGEVVAVISSAIAVITDRPHRILRISESSRSWSNEGRAAQHSHQPKH